MVQLYHAGTLSHINYLDPKCLDLNTAQLPNSCTISHKTELKDIAQAMSDEFALLHLDETSMNYLDILENEGYLSEQNNWPPIAV